jgi:hypothetical protein
MKLFLALLTNHKLDKLKRLVRTVELQYPEESIELKPVIVVNTLNDEYYQEVLDANLPFEVVRTESNGKPGKGKNSCMDLFLQSDCDFMTQVDGDDFLYPTFLRSIANHVNHYPDIDVLGRIPLDYLSAREINGGYRFMADESIYASVWGVSLCSFGERYPSRGDWLNPGNPVFCVRFMLHSRRSAEIKMHEDIGNGEDHLYGIQLLAEHIKGNLRFFLSASSDFSVIDKSLDDNIQAVFPQTEVDNKLLKSRMSSYVSENRSNFNELPLIFKDLLLNQFEKEQFIKNLFKDESWR